MSAAEDQQCVVEQQVDVLTVRRGPEAGPGRAALDGALQDEEHVQLARGSAYAVLGVQIEPRHAVDGPGLAHHEAQIGTGPIEELAAGLGFAGKESVLAAGQQQLRACTCDMQAKAAALDERDATPVPDIGGKGSALLQGCEAQPPDKAIALRRRAGDLARDAGAISPGHGRVGGTRKMAMLFDHVTPLGARVA